MINNVPDPKIFAIGDIHGSMSKLDLLMKRLPYEKDTDTLVFMGDYINRGPDSRQVIEYLIDLKKKASTVFLIGNHEHSLLEYKRSKDPEVLRELRAMGIESTLESYGEKRMRSLMDLSFMPDEHILFLEELKPYYRQGNYLFVHAGICTGEEPENCPIETLVGLRSPFTNQKLTDQNTIIVFGHTPFETPFAGNGMIGIDTGAVYGNMLTAVELPTMMFYHA